MLDIDLAKLYEVETKVLKQAVKRNIDRFPEDFMFELNKNELESLRSVFVTLEKGKGQYSKYLPFVFTEQGVAMLSGVLKSKRATEVNITIMRTFVQFRKLLTGNKELTQKIKDLESLANERFSKQDEKFQLIFKAIKELIEEKNLPRKQVTGFKIKK